MLDVVCAQGLVDSTNEAELELAHKAVADQAKYLFNLK